MQGRVYHLLRPGLHDNYKHPNAVVVNLGDDQFLTVAGFTPGKEKYQQAEAAEQKQWIWGPAFAVVIDHRKDLIPASTTLVLHECGYVCQTAVIMTTAQVQAGSYWGTLSDRALKQIAEGLLTREAAKAFLPRVAVVALKRFLAESDNR